jgi:DNA topoisomerase-1
LPKTTKIEKLSKEEALNMIEAKTPKKKIAKKKVTKRKTTKKK